LGAALVFFVPGYLLTKACWPRKHPVPELGWASIPLMGLVLSLGITIVAGSVLGFLPHPGKRGFFQTWSTGVPILEMVLLGLSVAFFMAAAARGAFPRMSRKSREGGGFLAEGGMGRFGQRLKEELLENNKPRREAPPPSP
ncbi:MAG TPA: hypothetical protein VNZ52_11250, partial [Candidatus Thermoplasmatota archaeon]|nr:hypothetical protein [Candidatus Thermoplasmatota archaeon]